MAEEIDITPEERLLLAIFGLQPDETVEEAVRTMRAAPVPHPAATDVGEGGGGRG